MARIYLNEEWMFAEQFKEQMLQADYDAAHMQKVRLPHTCKEVPYNYFDESNYQMVSGYRRILYAPKEWTGKCVLLTCEGAGHETDVFVNGIPVYKHLCGYTAFTVDLAPYLQFDKENVLLFKVNSREDSNIPPFGFVIDYMTFGGIYREVYLEIKEPEHFSNVFVIADDELECQVTLSEGFRGKNLWQEEQAGKNAWCVKGYLCRSFTEECPVEPEDPWKEETLLFEETVNPESLSFPVYCMPKKIRKWHVDAPYLYELRLELQKDGQVYDVYKTRFGFRKAEFKADGFYLNGEKTKIRGLNRHQSYPYVGYAMPERMQKYDADILKKELGCNAVRTSHYPQSHHFIDRCDELGLLVFMEIPGWQHIGDGEWKTQACQNVKEMIIQYRNHPSIFIWGVRINESQDDDVFYEQTNRIAHDLDPSRPTGGVRNFKKSHLLEDVYTYNDFLHNGVTAGCDAKKAVTSDMTKGYLITEYNGHMYPTKSFDWEEHRLEHTLRHVRVLDAVGQNEDIAGSFGWCMFDYNTHKDFGSGDRICYHGVTDMFRNQKPAAAAYSSQQEKEIILELSSSMDIGEHPATNLGPVYLFTNADAVRMYKNDHFIKEYKRSDSPFKGVSHGPLLVDDFVGDMLETVEGFKPKQSRMIANAMNYIAVHGYQKFPLHILWACAKAIVLYHMKPMDLVHLYTKYVGNWGETATVYRFEAIKDGQVVKTLLKQPMKQLHLSAKVSHSALVEGDSYDVALIRLCAVDENGNGAPYYQEAIKVKVEGPLELIGPDVISCKGGMTGLYVKTVGKEGTAVVSLSNSQLGETKLEFHITKK